MLRKSTLRTSLALLPEFQDINSQLLEGNGLDAILELLTSMRSVSFPCVVLEGRSSGSWHLVEGPVDTFTQSLWVMGQLGRGEEEAALYDQMFLLAKKVLAKLLQDRKAGVEELQEWDWQNISYMKRHGGQNARGWEIVLTFRENVSLLYGEQ